MKKCPVCESNYWDNCICTVCGYDGSKDYENYKTLTKIPRVIAAQYKGNKAASAALKEISFLQADEYEEIKQSNTMQTAVEKKNCQQVSQGSEGETLDIKLQENASPTNKKKPFIKKDLLLGIGIGILAMLIVFVFLGKGDESDSVGSNTAEASSVSNMDKPKYPLMSDAEGYIVSHEEGIPTVFGSEYQRRDITEIQFLDSTENAPVGEYWDVSADGSVNVIAWVDAQNILYIAADGIIQAPGDCVFLFAGYENVKKINFNSCFDTSQVTGMYCMFSRCSSLTSIDVSGFDTSQVTDMRFMFDKCRSLTSIDVSGFDTSQVTSMSSMFYGCSSLTSIDVSGFDTSQVTLMMEMFYGCSSLTSIDVSGFDTSQVTYMSYMFYECRSLTSIDVSGFDTSQVTGMSFMFDGCRSLTSIDVSGFDTSQVTDMGGMFASCSSLISVDVSGFDTSQVTDMVGMFNGCSSLTSVDVSGFDTSQVTDMSSMFNGCESLTSIDVSGFDTSQVTDMSGMFDGCSSLTNAESLLQVTSRIWRFHGKIGKSDNYSGGAVRLVLEQDVHGVTKRTMIVESESITFPYTLDLVGEQGIIDGRVIMYENVNGEYKKRCSWPVVFSAE